jgi:hypothetical protein
VAVGTGHRRLHASVLARWWRAGLGRSSASLRWTRG